MPQNFDGVSLLGWDAIGASAWMLHIGWTLLGQSGCVAVGRSVTLNLDWIVELLRAFRPTLQCASVCAMEEYAEPV